MKRIAFCGIDGSGKTTQLNKIKKEMEKKGKKVFVAKVPYYPFHTIQNQEITQREIRIGMAFEYAQYYLQLLPKLTEDPVDYLLCDRSSLCHLAFALTYGIPLNDVKILKQIFDLGGEPDLTFFFDLPVETALERISKRREKEKAEDETYEILSEARKKYRKIIELEQNCNIVELDATLPLEQQTSIILNRIHGL